MSAPIHVAIIGAGIGAEHLQAYLTLPEYFVVTHVCDLNEDKAAAIALPHGIADKQSARRAGR